MKRKIVGIIQARMGARRLPNKMLLHLHGFPVIEWVFRRSLQASLLDELIVAIPTTPEDDLLELYLKNAGARVFRGSETDLVQRFYSAARACAATHVIRICADNPLICGSEIDYLVDFYFSHPCDYAYNHIPRGNTYPDGMGAEMISSEILETIHTSAQEPDQREHLMNYLWDNPSHFVIKTFDPPDKEIAIPHLKLDLDTLTDYGNLLRHKLSIGMTAREIVRIFLEKS